MSSCFFLLVFSILVTCVCACRLFHDVSLSSVEMGTINLMCEVPLVSFPATEELEIESSISCGALLLSQLLSFI